MVPVDELRRDELLSHYQQRAEAADAERRTLLARLEACQVPQAQLYKLQTECRRRGEEVRELQKALSDAHTFLFEERERLLALQAENDALKLQEVEDRKRIKQLLALTRPAEQVVRPGQENALGAVVFPRGRSPGRQRPHGGGSSSGGIGDASAPSCGGLLRTVYLPSAQQETLALKCEALTAQLAEQKRFASERVSALLEDRAVREREAAVQATALAAAVEELTDRLRGSEEALRRTTKDWITAKQQRDAAAAEAAAARAALAEQREVAAAALAAAEGKAADDLARVRAAAERSSAKSVERLEAQLREKAEAMVKAETVFGLIRSDLEARLCELEERSERLAERNRRLEARRACDMQGWLSDVTLLRKQIAAVDRKLNQMRLLERLPDDERRDAILAKHAALAPGALGDEGSDPFELSLDALVAELAGLKASLLGMGTRVREQQDVEWGCSGASESGDEYDD